MRYEKCDCYDLNWRQGWIVANAVMEDVLQKNGECPEAFNQAMRILRDGMPLKVLIQRFDAMARKIPLDMYIRYDLRAGYSAFIHHMDSMRRRN